MGKLIILRHGQTHYNVQKLMTGHAEADLTEIGKQQAKNTGRALKNIKIDKVYSSTLSRAFNTASLILSKSNVNRGAKIEQRFEIIEKDVGEFTGRHRKNDPEVVKHPQEYHVPLPGGESYKDVVERIGDFFEAELSPRLKKKETVLVVCHAGVVRAFQVYLGDVKSHKVFDSSIPNSEPWVIEFNKLGLKKDSYLLKDRQKIKNIPPRKYKP